MTRDITATAALHARPASLLARDVARLQATVTVRHGERVANAKGALSMLALAIEPGDTVSVEADGADAAEAIDAVARHLTGEEG